VVKTINRGQSWQAVLTDANRGLFDLAFSSAAVGYAAGPNRLWKTINSGANRTAISNFNFGINAMSVAADYIVVFRLRQHNTQCML
jgi:hypothetical protein